MSKRLKLFGLLALTLALGAGVAWGFVDPPTSNPLVLAGEDNNAIKMDANRNEVKGNGSLTGGMTGAAANSKILNLDATKDNTITLAPAATFRFMEAAGQPVQVLVNQASDKVGKVVIKASNGDNPTPGGADMTSYTGGTVQMHGVLGVTNNNSLGQRWVGVLGNLDEANAPVFQVEGVDKVYLGVNDPIPAVTQQPFFLMFDNTAGGDPLTKLTYVKVKADAISTKLQGLWLMHGLDQVGYAVPDPFAVYGVAANDTLITAADGSTTGFVRLVKQGKGSVFINSDTAALETLPMALPYDAVDGAHHRGGTVVEDGVLQVDGGNASVRSDHFRGSLGKVWKTFQGSSSAMADPYDPASYFGQSLGNPYNPLFILNSAKVMVNRSQFFSDFNVEKDATFHVDEYTLAGDNYNPQVTVTLDQKDSKVDGLLEGKFDLVLNSVLAGSRPANDPTTPAIGNDGQAILFINKPENAIFAAGETLVANGVLEIMGNKSIGGGKVTVGTAGDRGFTTANLATFASSKTFKLENETFTKGALAALAVERGETLSFKDITMAGTLTINPGDILNHAVPFVAPLMPKTWSGTVEFGAASSADALYRATGVKRSPTNVFVDRGVWQLNSFPARTKAQEIAGEDPFMDVTLVEGATLSLGKDINDFKPYMDLTVRNDSRIRVVLRDSDIAATRADAMGKAPVFAARQINYNAIGYGEANRDRRLVIQLDPTQLTGKALKKGWIKLVFSPDAVDPNALHFLRENSNVQYEDYAKVRITWTTTSDIVKNAVAHLDENSYTILLEVGADVTDPVNPGTPTPTPDEKPDGPEISAPATVEPGKTVTFTLGDWYYNKKKLAAGDIKDIVWMLDGKDVTAQVKGTKLEVNAPAAEGTMTLEIKGKLVSDPTKELSQKKSVTVKKAGTTPTPTPDSGKSSGGGCDAGFGGLMLALGGLFLLKRKA